MASWPRSETADAARWRGVEAQAARAAWAEVLRTLATLDPAVGPVGARAALVRRAHAGRLADATTDAEHAAALREATAALQPTILGEDRRWPTAWTAAQRDAALVLGRGHLARDGDGPEYAARVLRVALRGEPAAPAAWRRRAVPLLVTALVAAGERDEATTLLEGEAGRAPEALTPLLDDASDWLDAGPLRERPGVADRLAARLGWRTNEGTAPNRTRASRVAPRPEERAGPGRVRAATLGRYEARLAERPDDHATLVALARLLEADADPAERLRGAAVWRRVENRAARGSAAWWQARVGRLRTLVAAGETATAQKLVRLTGLLAGEPPPTVADAWRAIADGLDSPR